MSDINELQAEIVRLTVDRDNWRNQAQTELRELSAAQARVKDMERDLAAMTNATNLAIEQRDKAQTANVELAGAHAAGEPAKHPDTKRLDWLEGDPQARLAEVRRLIFTDRDTAREAIDAARKEVQP